MGIVILANHFVEGHGSRQEENKLLACIAGIGGMGTPSSRAAKSDVFSGPKPPIY
jgi:hypothetical protein